jgi:hypothetical protein
VPRPASAVAADGLPLWDTFEALFFLVAGLSAGVVLGILLPSLWRTLRRRFRRVDKVAPLDERLLADVLPPLELLKGNLSESESDERCEESDNNTAPEGAKTPWTLPRASIAEAFVYARFLIQERKAREAIRVYLELLRNDRISKGQTNRALFELAQCYADIGLEARALDTFLELHYRRPERPQVLLKALGACRRLNDETRLLGLLDSYKGTRGAEVREAAASTLCVFAEDAVSAGQAAKGLMLARKALRWQGSDPHGQSLVWRVTSDEAWAGAQGDVKNLWSTFGADWDARFEISKETGLSPAAGAHHLALRLANLAASPEAGDDFRALRREFKETAGFHEREGKVEEEELFEGIAVYGFLELFRYARMAQDASVASLAPLLLGPKAAAFVEKSRALLVLAGFTTPWPLLMFFLHICGRCQAVSETFQWSCPRCGGHATLQPATPRPWITVENGRSIS